MHARVNQNGNVYPCCRMEEFYTLGSLKEKTFVEIWNDSPIKNLRNTLIQDLPFASCSDCYKIEAQGGISLRQKANSDFAHHLPAVGKTQVDGSIETTGLEFLDLRFSNICNFKCRSCNHENSTAWYHDARSFVNEEIPDDVVRLSENPEKIWSFIKHQLPTLKRIYLAGGEPMLQEEHYQLLELLIAEKRTDIAIEYNTNLSTLEYKGWKAVELWSHFPHITLGASLDGVGEQAELIRKGLDWKKTMKNFSLIQKEAPHVKFILAPTISVMNCFHITVAIETFVQNGMLTCPDFFRPNVLLQPNYLSVQILNPDERKSLEKHYLSFLNSILETTPAILFEKIERELQRILIHINSSPCDLNERIRFKKFTIKLDQLRNEKTVLLFPELMDLIFD